MRDYTQPHPNAIFKDKPIGFIEVYRSPFGGLRFTNQYKISNIKRQLNATDKLEFKTIALFIIKPRKHPLTPSQWAARVEELNNNKTN